MIMSIYKKAFAVLMRKPLRLWGVSLLCILLCSVTGVLCGIIPVLALAVTLLLETAMTIIFLRGYRGEEPHAVDLFACFRDWATIKRVLCGMGWMLLWIFLWSLIPIVGVIFGIIRTYEYRLTPYILVMEPDVKPTEAIKLSKERTKGWKGKMFGADVLVIVAFYVVLLILLLFARIPYIGVLFAAIMVLFVIAFIILAPLFLGLVQAAFYEEICAAQQTPEDYDPSQEYGERYDREYAKAYPPEYQPPEEQLPDVEPPEAPVEEPPAEQPPENQ